jgi:hypothetical protein
MFRSQGATSEPLDDAIASAVTDPNPRGMAMLQHLQPKLLAALGGESPTMVVADGKQGVALTPEVMYLLDKRSVVKAPADKVLNIEAYDDQVQTRTVVIWFDLAAIDPRRPGQGVYTIALTTRATFEQVSTVLRLWKELR